MKTLVMEYVGDHGIVTISSDGIDIKKIPCENFFSQANFLAELGDESEVYVDDFQTLSLFFIKGLLDVGYHDTTKDGFSYTGKHKIGSSCFEYLLSSDSKTFFSISYNTFGNTTTLYEMKNFLSINMEDIVKDFEGEPAAASWKAISSLKEFSPRSHTISGCAYSRWKRGFERGLFEALFPAPTKESEDICRHAYHGGLCLIKDGAAKIGHKKGITIDANSLYPYIMKTRKFPIGKPRYAKGDVPEHIKKSKNATYFIHFKAAFELKPGHIPFVRTRYDDDGKHLQSEILDTSVYTCKKNGKKYFLEYCEGSEYVDKWGEIYENARPITVELCMYKPEFELFFEQYDVSYIEIIDHVWYDVRGGIFTDYVDFFYNLKKNAKTRSQKRLAKMMLNALSGRMSLKIDRDNSWLAEDISEKIDWYGSLEYHNRRSIRGKYTKKSPGESPKSFLGGDTKTHSLSRSHIAIGAAITSEAMVYMVRLIQKNYGHFVYSDTDSMHLRCGIEDLVDIKISDELGDFKVEEKWIYARFLQDKVYYMIRKDGGTCKVTWAGMPEKSQELLEAILYKAFWENVYADKEEEIDKLNSDMVQIWDILRSKNESITENRWKLFMKSVVKFIDGTIKSISIPYAHRIVSSYKNYTFLTKIGRYKVDIFTE